MATRYTTIQGRFYIFYPEAPRQGPEPDGDTIKFQPDDPALVRGLRQFGDVGPDFNRDSRISVRFEGIDALETHFQNSHQDLELAFAARNFMLARLGFEDVVFRDDNPNLVESVRNNPLRGHIVANGLDGNGRILAFVYPGNPVRADGEDTFLDEALMLDSVNLSLLDEGLAYPAIYTSLPVNLADAVRTRTAVAREAGNGVFARESINTERAAPIRGIEELEELVLWPKLFRRLANYFSAGFPDLSNFDRWLREDPIQRDDRLILPNGELGNMHDFSIVEDGEMRLRFEPEGVTILPDNA
jgi:endonuclease YncB( thermonuclease family)